MLVGIKDARRDGGATGGGIACTLSSAPEWLKWRIMASGLFCDTVWCFNVVLHGLMDGRVKSQMGSRATNRSESEISKGFH